VPHEELRALRDRAPASWQDEPAVQDWPAGPGYWAASRHADVKHVSLARALIVGGLTHLPLHW
jgi:hypothetical protein